MMFDPALIGAQLEHLTPEQVRSALSAYLPPRAGLETRTARVEQLLLSPAGPALREAAGRWIVERLVTPERLVPAPYARWRPVVRDAMLFVISNLSAPRLAPKLLEQLDLPPKARAETRLLRLIAKVPGLQKLGQVLARNPHLRPSLRRELIKLENSIHDVGAAEIRALLVRHLGARLKQFEVLIAPRLAYEGSVSAIVRFTWRNPQTGRREPGIFKVKKPHISACFGEDMRLLQNLTAFFGARLHQYGFGAGVLPDTFAKVRRLLQHEVNYLGEQATLHQAARLYAKMPSVRVPRVIEPLCSADVTALSRERGSKITSVAARIPESRRARLAEQLVEALLAVPLFAAGEDALFHADPHAGNLLYDSRRGELVLLDWALTGHLTREQRRHLTLLFLLMGLRDRLGVVREIEALREKFRHRSPSRDASVRQFVLDYVDQLPWNRLPSAVDAMSLLEHLTLRSVRFPASLVMLSKVLFTLDGILHDIGATDQWMWVTIARHLGQRWVMNRGVVESPLRTSDWFALPLSVLLFGGRLGIKMEEAMARRFLADSRAAAGTGAAA